MNARKVWTTKAGEKVRICDMSDDHLINTIRYLDRTARTHAARELASAYSAASFFTGEQATFEIDQMLASMEDQFDEGWDAGPPHPAYDDLCREADRRGLKT